MPTCDCLQLFCAICRIACFKCCQKLTGSTPPEPKPKFSVVAIGLTQSGKSLLLAKLSGESTDDIPPTVGFSIKACQFPEAVLDIKELGGGENVRQYWHHYYNGTDGIVFIVDSSCEENLLKEAVKEFHSALSQSSLAGLPLLVLANKQDLPNARNIDQITDAFDLETIGKGRKCTIHACSSEDIDAVRNGFGEFIRFLLTENPDHEQDRI